MNDYYKKSNISEYPENWSNIIKRIKRRDHYTCQECDKKYVSNSRYLRVHHKIPVSKGGTHHGKNLITLCWSCHISKHKHLQRLYEKRGKKSIFYKKSLWRKRLAKKHGFKSKRKF